MSGRLNNFTIAEAGGQWRWRALGPDGRLLDYGMAPSRQIAAACVIRCLVATAAPPALRRAA